MALNQKWAYFIFDHVEVLAVLLEQGVLALQRALKLLKMQEKHAEQLIFELLTDRAARSDVLGEQAGLALAGVGKPKLP